MYPKPLMDLSGWNMRCMDSSGMHHFKVLIIPAYVGATLGMGSWDMDLLDRREFVYCNSTFRFFELLLIVMLQTLAWFMRCRSSAVPNKVEIVDGMHVIRLVFGTGACAVTDLTSLTYTMAKLLPKVW
ncbi:hypothetical protein Vadar_004218 [Vaccinium darrowii]|uniref:Uncharacterized protein n=1 Tax=Vaccinium darrowii TaxID=229202 RepID=A0ACB7Y6A5_9ERIC|nr:hypothetical protein Vadar_004218 [Vaccinium darrowii]